MKLQLTPDQQFALRLLESKGAGMTAAATRDAWEKGETYYIDTRNPARRKGVMRAFNKGNRDAATSSITPTPTPTPTHSAQ
jgi:hypothetical protein